MNEPHEGFFILTFSYIGLFSWFMEVQVHLRFLVALKKANATGQDKESCLNFRPHPLQAPPAADRKRAEGRIAGEHATARIVSQKHGKQNVTLNP